MSSPSSPIASASEGSNATEPSAAPAPLQLPGPALSPKSKMLMAMMAKIETMGSALSELKAQQGPPASVATKAGVQRKHEWWVGVSGIVNYPHQKKAPGNFLDCDKTNGTYCADRLAWVAIKNELVETRLYPAFPTSSHLWWPFKALATRKIQALGYELGPPQLEQEMEKHLSNVRGSKRMIAAKALLLQLHTKEKELYCTIRDPTAFTPALLNERPSRRLNGSEAAMVPSNDSKVHTPRQVGPQALSAAMVPSNDSKVQTPQRLGSQAQRTAMVPSNDSKVPNTKRERPVSSASKSGSVKKGRQESLDNHADAAVQRARSWTDDARFFKVAVARGEMWNFTLDDEVLGAVRLLATSGKLPNRVMHGYIRCDKQVKWVSQVSKDKKKEAFPDYEAIPSDQDKDHAFKTVAALAKFVGPVDLWWENLQPEAVLSDGDEATAVEDEELDED
jgi:hypothetical protein